VLHGGNNVVTRQRSIDEHTGNVNEQKNCNNEPKVSRTSDTAFAVGKPPDQP
jgi:hypothetical protein